MRTIKHEFDPRGILNPGRFLFESGSPKTEI
jgi:FAD/FMN-containing dehydrogenase